MAGGVAREIELHEARAWAACVAAAAQAEGNPLDASVDVVADVRLPALGAIDAALFNRVIGLGVAAPADDGVLDAVVASYAARNQTRFTVEVTPSSQPADLHISWARRAILQWQDPAPRRLTSRPGGR
jgi:hypothetical protein